jgi:hypothetical protein
MNAKLHKLFGITKKNTPQAGKRTRPKGQSLVEIAIAFPVIILLMSGMIEFGFILNYYLSLLDATRDSARYYSGGQPRIDPDGDGVMEDDMTFYYAAAELVRQNLEPVDVNDTSRKIIFNDQTDDIIIVVFNVDGTNITRYPTSGDYRRYENQLSSISNDDINAQLISGAPNTAIILVEVYWAYHQLLALPWLAPFLPDPTLLHAYSMMPMPEFARQPNESGEFAIDLGSLTPLFASLPGTPQE